MSNKALVITNLTKQYHTSKDYYNSELATVLDGLSFIIHRGEKWGVIGRNGSGKSTLLKILSGIVKPSSGSVEIYGTVSHILSVGDNFIPELTGEENATIFFRLKGIPKQAIKQALLDTAAFAEIGDYFYLPVKTYSDGMYLRLAFAACLQISADILLIDEVFSVGDAAFQEKIRNRFDNKIMMAETLVMVSHNPEEIIANCTHCLWIEKGKIMKVGEAKDVEAAYYYQLAKENWHREYNKPMLLNHTNQEMRFEQVENHFLIVVDFCVKPPENKEQITYETGLLIYIEIDKKLDGVVLHPAIKIFDYLMNPILLLIPHSGSETDLKIKEHYNTIGKMVFEIKIDPYLLTFGSYYAELIFSKDASPDKFFLEEALKVNNKIPFEVKQGEIFDYAGGTDNIFIKPQCSWVIKQIG